MNTENTLLSVSEAKKQLGVSSQSIRRFISEGQLIGEKTNTGRWAVESDSVRELLARRKSPHNAKPNATQQATTVASNSAPNAINRQVNTALRTDIPKLKALLKPYYDENSDHPWATAQQIVKTFHQHTFDFVRPEKFHFNLVTDWSSYIHSIYMEEATVGQLYNFDQISIEILLTETTVYKYEVNLPDEVYFKHAIDLIGYSEFDSDNAIVWKHIAVYYDEIMVCRSAPIQLEVLVTR
jgi:hypothetical protein